MKEGNFESSPSVVERQETNLAVDSFDYCVIQETTEEILGTKFEKLSLQTQVPNKEPVLGF